VFGARVGVHQGSVLSPLRFVIVLDVLSRKFREGLPMELQYADAMEELLKKIEMLKKSEDDKRVNSTRRLEM